MTGGRSGILYLGKPLIWGLVKFWLWQWHPSPTLPRPHPRPHGLGSHTGKIQGLLPRALESRGGMTPGSDRVRNNQQAASREPTISLERSPKHRVVMCPSPRCRSPPRIDPISQSLTQLKAGFLRKCNKFILTSNEAL